MTPLLFALGAGELAAQKTDVVVLENGDRFTGEIKQLSRGQIEYATDDVGRIYVEWVKVARVTSPHYFEVQVSSGQKYYGRLAPSPADKRLVVELDRGDTLSLVAVVSIVPISRRFVDRLKLYLDIGFTIAKANAAKTLSVSTQIAYRTPKLGATLSFDDYAQVQTGSALSTRNTLSSELQRFFTTRWTGIVPLKVEQNDELGLTLRVSAGAAVGRQLTHTNETDRTLAAGLVITHEQFSSSDTAQLNLEGVVNFAWDGFRYDSPKLDFSTQLTAYPSITSLGRVRAALNLRLSYELFKDFTGGITLTDSFDSQPPDPTAANNDFVITLTIGWSYRR